jgi:drug/metabolite transporter (DMT)-like permease
MRFSPRFRAVFQALLVTFLWSTSWVLIKIALPEIPPLTFAGLRYTLAFVILLPGLWQHRAALPTLSGRDWGRLAALGVVFYTLTQGGQFLTLNHLEATTFSLLLNFTAVLVALVGVITLREIPTRRQWTGMMLFLGGVLVYFQPLFLPAGQILGLVFAIITVCANAAASVLGRSVNRASSIPPLVVTVLSMGLGALLLLGTGLAVQGLPPLSWRSWAIVVWLAVVNTALAFTLWNITLRTLTAVESSLINNTMLVQIAVLAWLFLGEPLTWAKVLGLGLATGGILMVQLASSRVKEGAG